MFTGSGGEPALEEKEEKDRKACTSRQGDKPGAEYHGNHPQVHLRLTQPHDGRPGDSFQQAGGRIGRKHPLVLGPEDV